MLVLTRHWLLDQPTPLQSGAAVALSVVLAWASLRWVESTVRQAPVPQPVMLLAGACMIGAGLAGAWIVGAEADQRAAEPGHVAALRAGAMDFSPDRKRCHSSGNRWLGYEERCLFGPPDAKLTLAVWGDSHGVEIARALGNVVTERRVAQLTGSSCPPALGYAPPGRPRCASTNDAMVARLAEDSSVDAVLLAARYEFYLRSPEAGVFDKGLAESIRRLREAGKRVLLLDPVPTYHYPLPAALAMRWRRGDEPAAQGQPATDYRVRQAGALALVERLAEDGQAERVRLGELLCQASRCEVLQREASLYFDDNHLSMTGAAKVAPVVLRLLEVESNAMTFERR